MIDRKMSPDQGRSLAGPDRLLTPAQAADMLAVKAQTLAVWRSSHRHGLPYVKVGSAIRYRLSEIEQWLQARTVSAPSIAD